MAVPDLLSRFLFSTLLPVTRLQGVFFGALSTIDPWQISSFPQRGSGGMTGKSIKWMEGDLPELCDAPDGTEPHAFPDGHGFLKSIVF